MPFGLSGAPASFDRAIKLVMSGLNYSCCLCYFDDIIVPSNGIKQHCERLETVLSRLQQHNLKVKALLQNLLRLCQSLILPDVFIVENSSSIRSQLFDVYQISS